MIIEDKMIHGGLVRSRPTRLRRPRQPAHQPEHSPAPEPRPTVEPGLPLGEWDLSARSYQATQPRAPLTAAIQDQTGIITAAVAQAVCEEAGCWLGVPLPREWIAELAEHAEVVYQHNARFRQLLRRPATGRDWLLSFTRHWLCAILASRHPDLLSRLPPSYAIGRDLGGIRTYAASP
jgi:hypothetical protein